MKPALFALPWSTEWSDITTVLAGLGYGFSSALIPILNAEAYVVANAVLVSPLHAWQMVVAVSIGTVGGKLVIFRAARKGREVARSRAAQDAQVRSREAREPGRFAKVRRVVRKISDVLMSWLAEPWRAMATVVISAFVGIPPLLIVAAVAGMSDMGTIRFAIAVFVGRLGRFAVVAAAALGLS